eukprot:3662093-Pleurochrysis_carterae.AAC.2
MVAACSNRDRWCAANRAVGSARAPKFTRALQSASLLCGRYNIIAFRRLRKKSSSHVNNKGCA